MPSHKFHVGESVTLMPSISRNVTAHAGGSPRRLHTGQG